MKPNTERKISHDKKSNNGNNAKNKASDLTYLLEELGVVNGLQVKVLMAIKWSEFCERGGGGGGFDFNGAIGVKTRFYELSNEPLKISEGTL
jgi:hypothetical protein